MIGNFGNAEVFSFHATKFVNSAEGGAITTHDDRLAEALRYMRNFGFSGYDCVTMLGTNGNMSELSAAMGLTSLDAMEEFRSINLRNYYAYQNRLGVIPGIRLEPYRISDCNNYQYVVATVDVDRFGLTRDELVTALHAEHVLARRYFRPGCHLQEPYRTLQPDIGATLACTEALSEIVFQLPTGSAVAPEQIELIGDLMESFSTRAAEIRVACCQMGRLM
jgi:dTDP-4-amino-4,6-dideoxygalactose transaminase